MQMLGNTSKPAKTSNYLFNDIEHVLNVHSTANKVPKFEFSKKQDNFSES